MKRCIKQGGLCNNYAEYCENMPVRETRWGDMKDPDGRVGKYPDQYESLHSFMSDVWRRYRPYKGKQFFSREGLYQITNTDELICKNKESKFYGHIVENYYLTRPTPYKELKQHYYCSVRKHKVY